MTDLSITYWGDGECNGVGYREYKVTTTGAAFGSMLKLCAEGRAALEMMLGIELPSEPGDRERRWELGNPAIMAEDVNVRKASGEGTNGRT